MARTWTLVDNMSLPANYTLSKIYPTADLAGNFYFVVGDSAGKDTGEFIYSWNSSTKTLTEITSPSFYEINDILYWNGNLYCVWQNGWSLFAPAATNTYVSVWNGGTSWSAVYDVKNYLGNQDPLQYSTSSWNYPLAADADRIILSCATNLHMSADGSTWAIQTMGGDYTTYVGQQMSFGNIMNRPQISYDQVVAFAREGPSNYSVFQYSAGNNWAKINSASITYVVIGYMETHCMTNRFSGGWKLYYYAPGGWEDPASDSGLALGANYRPPIQYVSTDSRWAVSFNMQLWNESTTSFDLDGSITETAIGVALQYPITVYLFGEDGGVWSSTGTFPPLPSGDKRLWVYKSTTPEGIAWTSRGVTTP